MSRRVPWILAGLALAGVALPVRALDAGAAHRLPAAALPELPSVAAEVEGLYDEAGCLHTGPDEVDCSVPATAVDAALSQGAGGATRHLEGFVGSRWLTGSDHGGPAVLAASIKQTEAGTFAASGLARNEGAVVLATLEVTARLLDAAGDELAVVTVVSPVHDVRPGEPVPFVLTAAVDAEQVDRVDWSASGGTVGDGTRRALAWTPYWERPAGGEAVDLYLYRDPPEDRPHLVFGAVASVGDVRLRRPEVVVGWLGGDGRLLGMVRAPVRGPDGAPRSTLGAGEGGDALIVAGSVLPPGAEALVWVQGT